MRRRAIGKRGQAVGKQSEGQEKCGVDHAAGNLLASHPLGAAEQLLSSRENQKHGRPRVPKSGPGSSPLLVFPVCTRRKSTFFRQENN